jgi:hypothetical protein
MKRIRIRKGKLTSIMIIVIELWMRLKQNGASLYRSWDERYWVGENERVRAEFG